MTEWDGRGLPPAAAARMQRFARAGQDSPPVRSSLLSAPSAAALAAVGLTPIGEVMGTMVQSIGWSGWGGCGVYSGFGNFGAGTVTSSGPSGFAGYRPYVDALYRGYGTALNRLLREARAMGADGVVGISVNMTHLDLGSRESMMLGTAVRAAGRVRPLNPFTTDLSGTEVAKLLAAGWAPVGWVAGISVAIRHDDYVTVQQASSFNRANVEVSGYTELISYCRADARQRFGHNVRQTGADGAVVSSLSLRAWEHEPGENHRDHIAESTVTGTAVARFHATGRAPTTSLTILPLRPTARTTR